MTKFDTPKKVLDEFHSYMGSGLSMEYHINGIPEKMFIEELMQRDILHGQENNRDMFKKYIQALCAQKKLLRTHEGRLFTYTITQRKILEEKGLIQMKTKTTNWYAIVFLLLVAFVVLYYYYYAG